jgi:hypothetical protein
MTQFNDIEIVNEFSLKSEYCYPNEDRIGHRRTKNHFFAWMIDGATSVDLGFKLSKNRLAGEWLADEADFCELREIYEFNRASEINHSRIEHFIFP